MARRLCLMMFVGCLLMAGAPRIAQSDDAAKHPDLEALGELARDHDFIAQGEYAGGEGEHRLGAQVIAYGEGKFTVVLLPGGLPGGGWNGKDKLSLKGETKEGAVELKGDDATARIEKDVLTVKGKVSGELKKVYRVSTTMSAKPPTGAEVLFDGTNVDQWENGKIVDGKLLGVGCRTKAKMRDFSLHLEFRSPYMPTKTGQARGNSGMYLLDQYECQILDSFGLSGENNECGGFYTIRKPDVNMCLPPMSWQTYDVDFTAARFEGGKKVHNAVVTIKHNGVLIHDKVELDRNTPGGGLKDENLEGSLFLQDHGDAVRFRNIWYVKK